MMEANEGATIMFKFTLFTLLLLLTMSSQPDFEPLTAANAHRIELISTLGYGSVTSLSWIDNQTLSVGTTVNTYRHDLTQPDSQPVIHREDRTAYVYTPLTSPDGSIGIIEERYGYLSRTLQFYDTATGQERGDKIPSGDCRWEVSPTWQVIVLACGHVSLVKLYDTYGQEITTWDDDGSIKYTFSPDGSHLLVAYAGKVKTLWCEQPCASSFEIPYQRYFFHHNTALTASHNNRHLLVFIPHERDFHRGLLEVWDYREQRQLLRYAPDVLLLKTFYTPNEDKIIALTVSEEYEFSLVTWDTTDFHQTVYPFPPVNVPDNPYPLTHIYNDLASLSPSIEFSPDGSKLALSFYNQAFLWDLSSGAVWKPDLPVDDVMTFAPDNERIAVETIEDTVAVLNTTTRQTEHTFANYLDMVASSAPTAA
jgi:hypothetical protein